MADESRFTENLPELAAQSFELGGRLCGDCKNFHMLWPYHRLVKAAGGGRGARVQSALKNLLSQSGRKILIGGSADSGLLAIVAGAVASGTDITVLDRCKTPLELCRRFAERWSLPIKTIHLNLQDLSIEKSFDVVFVHMLLQFIPHDQHLDTMVRVRRSLRPGGRLLLGFRTNPSVESGPASESWQDYATKIMARLRAKGIPLPEPDAEFRNRLRIYFEDRRTREEITYADPKDVEARIRDAGFEIERVSPIATNFVQLTSNLRRYLAVAKVM